MATFLPLPGNEALAAALAALTGGAEGLLETRRFPDGETYVRILSKVKAEDVVLVCTLAQPDEKILPLLFAAATARELGARSVRLVAPYLAYMRQDEAFNPGEAVSSRHFARLLSGAFDGLITVDPHLHRYADLSRIYSCATEVVHAAPLLARWIRENVREALVVGPDSESEQWASGIAALAGAPHVVLHKERLGDRDVRLALPPLDRWRDRQPVLVDDIVSSGATLVEAATGIRRAGLERPWCLAVHAMFGPRAAAALARVTKGVLTTNSVAHPSNLFDLAPQIAAAL